MNITEDKTVASIVTGNIKTADVFKKYGIDFCCGGEVSIKKVCSKKGIDYIALEKDLEAVDSVSKAFNYDTWKLDFLIDHIVNIHHTYVEESTAILLQYANKVAMVHGGHHNEVVKINELFKEVAAELATHMKKEELVLFPYIKKLLKAKEEGVTPDLPHFGTVNNPINVMQNEHESAGDIFKEIAVLTNNYTAPEGACNTFKALYSKLQEFEVDLHQHIHLENNVLFPKAIQLEKEL